MKHFILPQNITTYIINNTTCNQFKKNKKELEWQKFVNEKKFNWEKSKIFAKQLKLNGSGWKLPKSDKLEGLVNENYKYNICMNHRKSLNFICFGNCKRIMFWSISSITNDGNYAWNIYFNNGNIFRTHISVCNFVRCVC